MKSILYEWRILQEWKQKSGVFEASTHIIFAPRFLLKLERSVSQVQFSCSAF